MKKLHLAIATRNIEAAVKDYSERFDCEPCVVIAGQYALWRTQAFNISIRYNSSCEPGKLRHMGWEDPNAVAFSQDKDVNGVIWEAFTAKQQAREIEEFRPGRDMCPSNR